MRFISNWTSCRSIEGIIGLVILNWHRCVVIRFSNNSCNYSFNRTSLSPIDTSRKWYLHLNNNTIKGRASTIFVSFSSSCCGGFFLGGGRLPAHTPPPQPPFSYPPSLSKKVVSLTYCYSRFKGKCQRYLHKICIKNVLVRVLTVVFKLWVTRETVGTVLCRHGSRDQ